MNVNNNALSRAWNIAGPPLVCFVIVVAVWQAIVWTFDIPRFQLPSPWHVARAAWLRRTDLAQATAMTGIAALAGFCVSLLVGCVVGVLFSQSRAVARGLYPYAIFLQTVPIVAIAPTIIAWCGTGMVSVIVVAFILGLFPIITNTYTGLMSIAPSYLELFELYNANRWQVLCKLRIPSALPHVVTGAKVSAGLSVIGAIVGEFFAGATSLYGLGYLIPQAIGSLKMDVGFAAVVCSSLLGLALFGGVSLVGNVLLQRWRSA